MLPQGNEGLTPKQISQRKYREANKEKIQAAAAARRLIYPPDYYADSTVAAREKYKKSERGAMMRRTNQRAKRYGLTREQAAQLLSLPCAICGGPSEHIDHNHTTSKVRAGLCGGCNKGLGMFKESPASLRAAANYLEDYMKNESNETLQPEHAPLVSGQQLELDFDSDVPLVCSRDQTGDTTCESCQ